MFCSKCGHENDNAASFCAKCGNGLEQLGATAVMAGAPGQVPSGGMGFTQSISTCLGKYFDFTGRAGRPEFWWFFLFTLLLSWGAAIVDPTEILSAVINLALLAPSLAVGARRLHDTGRSGWWQLLVLTVVGVIVLIVWWASAGSRESNAHGEPV